jgi:quercetin dioxygenase-like cupin family protein
MLSCIENATLNQEGGGAQSVFAACLHARQRRPVVSPSSSNSPLLPPAESLSLDGLLAPVTSGIGSRVLAKAAGGSVTLFAFDAGQGLSEHTSPFDALVLVQAGALKLTVGGTPVDATPGTVVRLPGGVPHALDATEPARMLLIMLR